MDCGPTCLRMVAKHYGKRMALEQLRQRAQYGKEGVSLLGLSEAAEALGFKTIGAKITYQQLINDAPLPAILHWGQSHFVVAFPHSFRRESKGEVKIADPASGFVKLSNEDFLAKWASTIENGEQKGVVLLLEPSPSFYTNNDMDTIPSLQENKGLGSGVLGWNYFRHFLGSNKAYLVQIIMGLFIASFLQLLLPYLTQSIVDTGIHTRDISFIQIILLAQLMLLFSLTVVEFIRSRLLLHISTRLNLSLLSSFWSKLLRLPMPFFDSRHPGDIMQRIGDHHRIESFLTGAALNTLFSIINLLVFSFVLLRYSITIFIIFIAGSLLYLLWIRLFLKLRRQLDYKRFAISSKENNATVQLVYGIQEIKLNNAENHFRWAWEGLQAGLFKLNFKSLSLSQYQQAGAFFINQGKNLLITFVVAKLVIEGQLSLGMMLAIQYIIGQMNSPIEQLIGFTQQAQDAKISLERLNDVHAVEDEEASPNSSHVGALYSLPSEGTITLQKISFTYPGPGNEPVLKNIDLIIPEGKVIAIVGVSGSGKTTLLKLLLRFYENYAGEIKIGSARFNTISPKFWRSVCGAVMQDPYIFNDNIRKNITVTDDGIDEERLYAACRTANILPFIESLPLGFYTKLGAEGTGISGGQKQRLAIARAVYKNPQYIFLDEATNSLDANNEKMILENLQSFFKGRTVVVVAHRLSTVMNADKIVVLENGMVAEEGTHQELSAMKGKYYALVKNQLELGD
jgi:ATP-binding cassette, subfamily B, bacterial